MIYRIDQAAKILDLDIPVLEHWANEGLIFPAKKENGDMLFHHTDIEKTRFVKKCLREDCMTFLQTKELIKKFVPSNNDDGQEALQFK